MADPSAETPPELPIAQPASRCRHLRTKGMYVFTDGVDLNADYGGDDSIYWCLKTMGPVGPDDELVDNQGCSNPGRTCFEEL